MFIEIIYFLIVSVLLGLAAGRLNFGNESESMTAKLLFGVCIMPLVMILLGFLGIAIPLSVLFTSGGLAVLFYKGNWFRLSRFTDMRMIAAWVLAAMMAVVFLMASFAQPWLEDGDPNGYAEATSYISNYRTFLKPSDMFVTRYMEPYLVGYPMVMGVVSSLNGDVNGTLKLINSILIALAIPALYLLSGIFTDKKRSLLCAFILFAIPSFSTRFIFAQSLGMLQIIMGFVFLYWGHKWQSGLCFGALFLTHQLTAIVAIVLALIWIIVDYAINKRLSYDYLSVGIICLVLFAPWWAFQYSKYGTDKILNQLNLETLGKGAAGFSDPTMRYYGLWDFIYSPAENSIDNMTGVGIAIFLLFLTGIIWSVLKLRYSSCTSYMQCNKFTAVLLLSWTLFLILSLFSNWLPVSFFPSRMWVYVSIPVSIFSGIILYDLMNGKNNSYKILAAVAIIGIIVFSLYPKFDLNTKVWGNSRLTTEDEYRMAVFLLSVEPGTKVVDACMYERVWGFNLWDDPLDIHVLDLKNKNADKSKYGWDSEGWLKMNKEDSAFYYMGGKELGDELSSRDYKYVILGSKCMKAWNITGSELSYRADSLVESGGFVPAFNYGYEYVLGIK